MVTTVSGRKVVAADASQFNHSGKGRGLVWQGKEAITKRQLQQQEDSIRMTRGRPPKNHTWGHKEAKLGVYKVQNTGTLDKFMVILTRIVFDF